MKKFSTSVAPLLSAALLLALAGAAAAQQDYPNKPIRFITPFAPGGTTSVLARLIGQKLTDSWGQPVLVDNRPGGNTVIGSEVLVKSPPDGYTIMLVANTHVINPLLIPNLPYDTVKDFAPVSTLTSSETVLVLHPSVPANNLQELIALAKSKPGQLNYATTGSGTVTHVEGELFNMMAGVKTQHVPYKGGAPAITDLIGGQVQMTFNVPIALVTHIKSGRLKAMAITGEARFSALPQVPTFSEAGLPGFDLKWWYGVLAPAATPRAILDRLSTEIARILGVPDFKEKLDSQGMQAFISTPEQFAAMMKAETAKYGRIIKTANIKFEN